MENKLPWLRGTVIDVVPGATYEGVVYDQDLVIRAAADGGDLRVFDMAPRIAEHVRAGDEIDVVCAITLPADLRRGRDARGGRVVDPRWTPPDSLGGVERPELRSRSWCLVETASGPMLIDATEVVGGIDGEPPPGDHLAWSDGRIDLYAVVHAPIQKGQP